MRKVLVLGAFLLAGAGRAEAQLAWRAETPLPETLAKRCSMEKLEPYFWDYIEHLDKPVAEADWNAMPLKARVVTIHEHCAAAGKVHDEFISLKVRLDYALKMARGSEQLTPSQKVVLIEKTLAETDPVNDTKAEMIRHKMGSRSIEVKLINEARVALSAERDNLVTRRAGERVGRIETAGSLQGAGRIRAVGVGDIGAQKRAGDTLFLGAAQADAVVAAPERPLRSAHVEEEAQAGGALRAKGSKFDTGVTRNVPSPPRTPGFSSSESAFIQKRKDDAWFGFGWLAERRAKMDVDSVRSSVDNCRDHPTFCSKIETECRENPDLHGSCDTIRNRKEILGY